MERHNALSVAYTRLKVVDEYFSLYFYPASQRAQLSRCMRREDHRLLMPPPTLLFLSLDLSEPDADIDTDSNSVEGLEFNFNDDGRCRCLSELSLQPADADLSLSPVLLLWIRRASLAVHILGLLSIRPTTRF